MLTAQELNITEAEHIALQAVAAGLASGFYRHFVSEDKYKPQGKCFNMDVSFDDNSCGTVACIGGWVGLEMGKSPYSAHNYVMLIEEDHSLYDLYFPTKIKIWDEITPAIAAEAIYQFLDGKPVDYAALLAA